MKVERHYLKGLYSFAYIHANFFERIAIRSRMRKRKNIRAGDDLMQSLIVRIGVRLRGVHFVIYTKRDWMK